ncbi:MAG: hypothetical protein ACKPKO_26375, partial [Candidatus Fonsibacter sp.]
DDGHNAFECSRSVAITLHVRTSLRQSLESVDATRQHRYVKSCLGKEPDETYNNFAGVRHHAELYHVLESEYLEGKVRALVLRARWVALATYVNGCLHQRIEVRETAAQWLSSLIKPVLCI